MAKTYYIGWYISDADKSDYTGNVPGNLKMHYVVDQLVKSGNRPEIISFASRKDRLCATRNAKSQDCNLKYYGGLSGNSKVIKRLDLIIKKLLFIFDFIFRFRSSDTIVLYHSYEITRLVSKLKYFFKRRIIIEVEEVYGYSAVADRPWVNNEIAVINNMDYHICVNEGIPKDLGLQEGKYVVNYGVGNIPVRTVERFNDGKIHVVYAGTIEMKKLGALTAVESARYFPDNYVLHILGFGNKENLRILQYKIDEINKAVGEHRVEYDGYKSGKELDDFLFSCHIGLSSNVMRPNFANNSFPSKVITYMCHDLSVVLGYAKAFYDVPMSKGWHFYHEYTPESIAEAVANVEVRPVGYYHPAIENMNNQLQSFFKKYC